MCVRVQPKGIEAIGSEKRYKIRNASANPMTNATMSMRHLNFATTLILLFILLSYNHVHSYKFEFFFYFPPPSPTTIVCHFIAVAVVLFVVIGRFDFEQKVGAKLISLGPYAIGWNTKICITSLTSRVIRVKSIQQWIYSRWTMVIDRLSL